MHIRTQLNIFVVFLVTMLALSAVRASSDETADLAVPADQTVDANAYHAGLSEYFSVPPDELRRVAAGVEPVDLPVALFLARHGLSESEDVVARRAAGASWQDISDELEIGPETFYFPLDEAPITPFTNVYALYNDRNRAEWGEIRLGDDDVRRLVHLRFVSEHTGRRPSEVLRLHADGLELVALQQALAPPAPVKVAQAAPAGASPDRG